jgi:hypothetical protein
MKKLVKFNEKRALEVFRLLDHYWRNKIGIFSNIVLPQDKGYSSEEWDSLSNKEKANFLFYASLTMRGPVISEDPFKWIWALKREYPSLFEPEKASKWSIEEIMNAFESVSTKLLNGTGTGETGRGVLGFGGKDLAVNWLQNSLNLHKWWDGNVLNVFWGKTEFEEVFREIDNGIGPRKKQGACLMGMRRKIFSLFVIFLQEKNLIPIFPTPIPIDYHAVKFLWALEIISLNDWAVSFKSKSGRLTQLEGNLSVQIHEGIINQIAIWSQKFLQKIGISHLVINPAIWVFARSLCAEHLQASTKNNGTIYFLAKDLKGNPSLWPKNYKDPCAHCCVESFCKWAICSAPYYGRYENRRKQESQKQTNHERGFLIRFKRAHYHSPLLSGVNWSEEKLFKSKRQERGGKNTK